jgi:hypothetical protein
MALATVDTKPHCQFLRQEKDWYEDDLQHQQRITPPCARLRGHNEAASVRVC